MSYVSDHESGSPQVSIVVSRHRPSILHLSYTEVTGTEIRRGGDGLLCCLLLVLGENSVLEYYDYPSL